MSDGTTDGARPDDAFAGRDADESASQDTTWLPADPDTVRLGGQPTLADAADPAVPPVPPAAPAPPVAPTAGWSSPTGAPAPPPAAPPAYPPTPAPGSWQQAPPPPPPAGAWQQAAPMGAPGRPEWTGAALPGVAGWGAVQQAPKPGVVPLRPLGLGEILDGAVSYIRRDPRTVLGIAAVISLVVAAAQFVATWWAAGSLLGGLESTNPDDTGAVVGQLAGLTSSSVIPSLISFVLNIVAVGMLTVVMSQAVLGRRVTAREAWDRTSSAFWRLLGVTLLVAVVTVGVVLGGIALAVLLGYALAQGADEALGVIVGLLLGLATIPIATWLYVRWLLAPVAVVLERAPVVAAMRRSAALVKGSWWRLFGIYLLATIIAGVISQVIAVPLGIVGGLAPVLTGPDSAALWLAFATALATLVASVITIPFTAGVVSLLYIDRRIRREALDIELQRAAGVGGAAA